LRPNLGHLLDLHALSKCVKALLFDDPKLG
jgi:hypothetical protein